MPENRLLTRSIVYKSAHNDSIDCGPFAVMNSSMLWLFGVFAMLLEYCATALLQVNSLLYIAFSAIGEMAFPVFALLLVVEFLHTKKPYKEFLVLALFGIISEIPMNILCSGYVLYAGIQNIFFEMCIGLFVLFEIKKYEEKHVVFVGYINAFVFAMFAGLLHCYAGAMGIIIIVIFYAFRNNYSIKMVCFVAFTAFIIFKVYIPDGVLTGERVLALLCTPFAYIICGIIPVGMYSACASQMRFHKHALFVLYPVMLTLLCILRGLII